MEEIDVKYFEEEEAFWIDTKDKARKYLEEVIPEAIKDLEKQRLLNQKIVELCERELKKWEKKTGDVKSVKQK